MKINPIKKPETLKIKGGTYRVKLFRVRWWHRFWQRDLSGYLVMGKLTPDMTVYLDRHGNFVNECKDLHFQKGEWIKGDEKR